VYQFSGKGGRLPRFGRWIEGAQPAEVLVMVGTRSSGRYAMTCTVSPGEIEFTSRRYPGLNTMAGYPAGLLVRGTMPPATGSSRAGEPRGGA
jgi:hypothetical protein